MPEPKWTVLVVPHGQGRSRAVQISRPALRVILGSAVALPLAAAVLGYTTISKSVDRSRLQRLERQNQLLSQEISHTHNLLAQLGDTVQAITHRDRQVRLLAGLNPTDPDVQLAGIGGPTGGWTEREQLLAEGDLGRQALSLRLDASSLVRQANLLVRSFAQAAESLKSHTARLSHTPSISPTIGFLSSQFARERIHPIHHDARPHEGIDISAPMGTPIVATAGGLVVDVGKEPGYGNLVAIDHGYGVVTRYAHCSKILVRVGQRVTRNQEVALVGNTGIATAPRLHYEVIVRGQHIDPRQYIFPETIVD
jgi:hypothetical protein